jgi:hypothetical protein
LEQSPAAQPSGRIGLGIGGGSPSRNPPAAHYD